MCRECANSSEDFVLLETKEILDRQAHRYNQAVKGKRKSAKVIWAGNIIGRLYKMSLQREMDSDQLLMGLVMRWLDGLRKDVLLGGAVTGACARYLTGKAMVSMDLLLKYYGCKLHYVNPSWSDLETNHCVIGIAINMSLRHVTLLDRRRTLVSVCCCLSVLTIGS